MKKAVTMGFVFMIGTVLCAQSITLTTPIGGESWVKGGSKTIRWTGSDISAPIRILLFRGETRIGVIASGLPASTRSHPWIVGNYQGGEVDPGVNYKIRVKVEGQGVADTSAGPFEIKAERAAIHVTRPDGGSVWRKGKIHSVRWAKSGEMQDCVKLKLYGSKGNPVAPLLNDTTIPNNGRCDEVKIPEWIPPGKYRLQVETCDRGVRDRSATFVVDQPEIPDLIVTDLYKDGDNIFARVKNQGGAALPAMTYIQFHVEGLGRRVSNLGNACSFRHSPRTAQTASLGVNEVTSFIVYTISSSHIYNNYCSIDFSVTVNSDRAVRETNYSNNTKTKTICRTVSPSVSFTHTMFCGMEYFTIQHNQTITIQPCNVRGWRDGYAFMSIRVDATNSGSEPVDVIVKMIQKNNAGSVIYSGIVDRGNLVSCQRRAFTGNTAGMPLQEGTITLEIRNNAGNALLARMTYNIRWHGTIRLLPRGGIYE